MLVRALACSPPAPSATIVTASYSLSLYTFATWHDFQICTDEGTLFNQAPRTLAPSEYVSYVTNTYGPVLGGAIVAEYPLSAYNNSAWWATSHAGGDEGV